MKHAVTKEMGGLSHGIVNLYGNKVLFHNLPDRPIVRIGYGNIQPDDIGSADHTDKPSAIYYRDMMDLIFHH
jgi:hypothetical protein